MWIFVIIGLGIILSVFLYKAEPIIHVPINALIAIILYLFFHYKKECLMFFLNRYFLENKKIKENLVLNPKHDKIMFEHDYPMWEVKC